MKNVLDKLMGRSDPSADLPLVTQIETNRPQSINDVIALMNEIDAALPDSDGLKWFNRLYNLVTQSVAQEIQGGRFADGRFIDKLDVLFAKRYFDALVANAKGQGAPRAWRPLLKYRQRPGVSRLQFALAGMNAHINHDLAFAVVDTCKALNIEPERGSAIHNDYNTINDVLEEAQKLAIPVLVTGTLGAIERGLGTADNVLAMWSIRNARDSAWTNAEVLWSLRSNGALFNSFAATLDSMTGFAGRGLLVPGGLERLERD